MGDYSEFLEKKNDYIQDVGFTIEKDSLNSKLFDFQKDILIWALKKGRSALFLDCGLGKTFLQLEWSNKIYQRENKPILILAPLAVTHQTVKESEKFGIKVKYVEKQEDIINGINVTNYEKLHHFEAYKFVAIVLDESSILKSYTGKTRNQILDSFAKTKYKLACTATPAPNDFQELGNHSEFLGISTRMEMLSMFFINDTSDTGTWRLKGHAQKKYWEWVSNWAIMIANPKDLGYEECGFDLPALNFYEYQVETHQNLDGVLFKQLAQTLEERREARKISIKERVDKCKEIISKKPDEQWLVWCDFNIESETLAKEIDNSTEVTGSNTDEHKEKSMLGFANNEVQILISKPKIAGFGMNWQSCHNIIYCGLSDSYEAFYQSVRRCYRFGQLNPVNVHIVISDLEGNVLENVKRKEREAIRMQREMIAQLQELEIKQIRGTMKETMEYKTQHIKENDYEIFLGDSVELIKKIPDDSIHYSIFSPPFASLFTYSNSERDMGNCKSNGEFLEHFTFLAADLYRVTMPGRLLSFHVMNLPATIQTDGYIGIKDFRGDLIRLFESTGFIFHSEIVIWKDPLLQATRTKTLTLAHKQVSKDSSRVSQGYPDYIITMRKKGENPEPIAKGRGFENYIGEMPEPKEKKTDDPRTNKYSHKVWQRYASPVWFDIRQTRTLNEKQARDKQDERHMCPLQLDTIERCLELWTNEGDTVLSPFMGIGSEGYSSLQMNRKFIGIELKESYFKEAIRNLNDALQSKNVQTLFDIMENK